MNDILAEHAAYLRSPENVARLIVDLCKAEKRILELEERFEACFIQKEWAEHNWGVAQQKINELELKISEFSPIRCREIPT